MACVLFIPALIYFGYRMRTSHALRLLFWSGLGFLWAVYRGGLGLEQILPAELEGVGFTADGIVVSVPVKEARRTQFEFEIQQTPDAFSRLRDKRVRLSWYGQAPALSPGEQWQLGIKLRAPRSFNSPGTFDARRWALQQGLAATGYVLRGRKISQHKAAITFDLTQIRHGLNQWIKRVVNNPDTAGLLAALSVGLRSGISHESWSILRTTGTAHLMAISGLHIAVIALLGYGLGRLGWQLIPQARYLFATPRAASVTALGAAWIYAALAGFSLPTQRALIMVGVLMLATFFQRHVRGDQSLWVAVFVILVWDPLAILSPSFWLSFMAVGLLIWSGQTTSVAKSRKITHYTRALLTVGLGLLPLTLTLFAESPSFLSPLANAVAIPWVSILVIPPLLFGLVCSLWLPEVGEWLLLGAAFTIEQLWPMLVWLGELNLAFPKLTFRPIAVACALLGVFMILSPSGIPGRVLGWVFFLPLLFGASERPAPGEFWVSLLDVGQGLSAVVETHRHVLVYDTGPRFGTRSDAAQAVIIPFLKHRSWSAVDHLILSHHDIDHVGGARSLLAHLPVHLVSTNDGEGYGARDRCHAGEGWRWDGVDFEILAPIRVRETDSLGDNDTSCVMRIVGAGKSILLTGDVEKIGENTLIRHYGEGLLSHVLVVPHHGSRTSSSMRLLEQVRPLIGVVSAGHLNRFGMPHSEVLERYATMEVAMWQTAEVGTVNIRFEPQHDQPLVSGFLASAPWSRQLNQ